MARYLDVTECLILFILYDKERRNFVVKNNTNHYYVVIFTGQWDSMEEYMCLIPRTTYDGAFYRAVFSLHSENYQLAQQVTSHLYILLNIFFIC